MNSKIHKFLVLNSAVVGSCYVSLKFFEERINQKMYKKTTIFQEAMETLKSHRGAVYFLGELIKDGYLKVIDEKKEDDRTIYHVKVSVGGSNGQGNMYFWVSRKDQGAEETELTRIELQLENMKKRLLILDKNKSKTEV